MSKKIQLIIWGLVLAGGTLYGFIDFTKSGDKTAPALGICIAGLLTLYVICYRLLSGRFILSFIVADLIAIVIFGLKFVGGLILAILGIGYFIYLLIYLKNE